MSKAWNPQGRSLALLHACQRIFQEYSEYVTLRQTFYLLVEEGSLRNDEASWRKLKTLTLKARKHGRIPAKSFSVSNNPTKTTYAVEAKEYLEKTLKDFRIPRSYGQANYVEIWVEREPLNNFVEHLLGEYDVPVYVTGGYSNYSFVHSAAERLKDSTSREGSPRILYLSDFSASSFKMFEILSEELGEELGLSRQEVSSILFKVAVLPEHIVKYNLPVCYTASKEARSPKFDELYGDVIDLLELPDKACIEIESINPKSLSNLLHNVIFGLLDQGTMSEVAAKEALSIQQLKGLLGG